MKKKYKPRNPGFLFQSPDDGVINSYTFVGNHDKPRVLHCLALDMGLFHSGFTSYYPEKEEYYKKAAIEVTRNENVDFRQLNSMAIAMGHRINQAIARVPSLKNKEDLQEQLKDAVSTLAQGSHKGKRFNAEAFGTRPFEIAIKSVLDEVEYKNGKNSLINSSNREAIEIDLLKDIIEPAFDRYLSIYKMLVTLPGSPTDFAGDRVGVTGYESKAKNYYQQNRNVIPWEYLGDKSKYDFVNNFYHKMNEIAKLRNNEKLSALNDGATVTLPIRQLFWNDNKTECFPGTSVKLQAVLRYNDKGSVVISLHNNLGSKVDNTQKLDRQEESLTSIDKASIADRILLNLETDTVKEGLKHGIKEGTIFKNVRDDDKSTYKIVKMPVDGKEYYCLQRFSDISVGQEIPIEMTGEDLNTLILYKV